MKILRGPNPEDLVLVDSEEGYPDWIVEAVDVPPPGIDDIWSGTEWEFSPARQAERLAREAAATPVEIGTTLGNLQTEIDGKLPIAGEAATVATINGKIVEGTNVTITGTGTDADPYEIAASGGGGSGTAGQVVLTVPNRAIQATETLAATGVTGSSVVLISVAPHTDADENTAEMIDLAAVSATPGTDEITVVASFFTPHAGPIRFNWSAF